MGKATMGQRPHWFLAPLRSLYSPAVLPMCSSSGIPVRLSNRLRSSAVPATQTLPCP